METICKLRVDLGVTTLYLPDDANILCVKLQEGKPQMWVLMDTEAPKAKRYFITYTTGTLIGHHKQLTYIDTLVMGGDKVSMHLFEIIPSDKDGD